MEITEEIHDWLAAKRRLNRISWKDFGSIIDYTDNGVKKALENYRLSTENLKKLIIKFDLRTEFTNKFNDLIFFDDEDSNNILSKSQISEKHGLEYLSNIPDEHLVFEFINRYESLSKNPVIKNTLLNNIEIEVSKRVIEILSSKDSLMKYINKK